MPDPRTPPRPRDRAVAAVDLGTNSTRLLVVDGDGRPVDRRMTITRLGAGVDRTRALADDAVARTLQVLGEYRRLMDERGVGALRVTATSAARDATNREAFFLAVAETVGKEPELLTGDQEARLSFAGATAELDAREGPWLVVDIGGGSTELAVGPETADGPGRLRPTAARSLDMGCVRVTERWLPSDPPGPAELEAGRTFVAGMLDDALAATPGLAGAQRMVGLAGTVSAAASLDLRLDVYDRAQVHHHFLRRDRVAELLGELAALDVEARRRRPGMEAERADVIVGGLVVLDEVLARFDLDGCLVSESDILDGLVMSLREPVG